MEAQRGVKMFRLVGRGWNGHLLANQLLKNVIFKRESMLQRHDKMKM